MTAKVAKKYLPGVSAYAGIHERLRRQAVSVRGSA
jgi:hypothetical protein